MVLGTIADLVARFDWPGIMWGGLWASLVAFSLGLSFLLWTRWGDYHLTGKCVMFSLLAHTILGLLFATAEVVDDVVVALNAPSDNTPLTIDRVKVVTAADDAVDSTIDGRADEPYSPGLWDRVTGRVSIDSMSLGRDGPEPVPATLPERQRVGELTPLPQQTPKPNVAVADAPTDEPALSLPATDPIERAEMSAAPADPIARSGDAQKDVLPDSVRATPAPASGSSAVHRVTVADSTESSREGADIAAPRISPRIPAGGNASVPDGPARPIMSTIRSGAPGSDSVAITPGGPIAAPEVTAKSEGPRVGSGGTEPSSSVRIGVPMGSSTGTGAAVPTRSAAKAEEAVSVPRAKIAGSGASSPGAGLATAGTPNATPVRSGSAAAAGGNTGTDRHGSGLGTPEIYRERMSPNRSEQALKRGGSKASEEAVDRALEWLAAHQSSDGHWDADGFHANCPPGRVCTGPGSQTRDDCAITGLVLLAFLGAGNTHWEGKYPTNVLGGLNWLIQQEKTNGDLRGSGRMYSQGIATLALSEALAMSGDPKLREPVEKAVQFIIVAQNPSSGGWRYIPGQYGDTSVFGWQLMALKSASLAGIHVPDTTWQKARGWLHLVGSGRHRGLAAYQPNEGATPPMTAEALVCRVFLGESTDSPTLREAADYLMQYKPQWTRLNLYYWYYGTLACFQMSGDYWTQWNTSVRDVLISHQVRDGHAAGSWDPNATLDPWGKEGGRVYSTALAALCLEVYYRFLPVQSLTAEDSTKDPIPQRQLDADRAYQPARNR
jgi:hypothetical protein